MYFGSVRFFKHVIVFVVLTVIFSLTGITLYMAKLNNSYEKQLGVLKSKISKLEEKTKMYTQGNDPIAYQTLYPELYIEPVKKWIAPQNTVYLTFDDGPSDRTAEILDILKEQDIKATFFVVGKNGEEEKQLMRRIVKEGHAIGRHLFICGKLSRRL